ncbi:hypothetical protein WKW79_20085 [Variovorax robiniae]|uniref:Phasin domain-containing protein n=1 Tax=Variovorax robiniae TaxID=1836199 RepID=A0ABU8XAM7_9BURK
MPHDDKPALPSPDALMQPLLDWQKAFTDFMLQGQQNQLQVIAAWQRAMQDAQRDWEDRWICRFGGGVPLDG